MGVDPGENFFANTQANKERISSAERKVSDKERFARKERRARRKKYITDDAVINYKQEALDYQKSQRIWKGI